MLYCLQCLLISIKEPKTPFFLTSTLYLDNLSQYIQEHWSQMSKHCHEEEKFCPELVSLVKSLLMDVFRSIINPNLDMSEIKF